MSCLPATSEGPCSPINDDNRTEPIRTLSSSTRKDVTLTNQVLDYNDSRDIPRLVISRLENVDKMLKLNPRINPLILE